MVPSLAAGWLDGARLFAIAQVLVIDVTLAGDNAVVVGLAVAGLTPRQRVRAVAIGVAGAAIARVLLALVAVRLLAVIGLTLAGGLLLLWVAWRSARELGASHGARSAGAGNPTTTFGAALFRIAVADLSMSLDNVLAVAGAARNDLVALAIGLVVAIVLMGVAATLVANLLERYRWIAFIGIAIVLVVALRMIWHGGNDVLRHTGVLRSFG